MLLVPTSLHTTEPTCLSPLKLSPLDTLRPEQSDWHFAEGILKCKLLYFYSNFIELYSSVPMNRYWPRWRLLVSSAPSHKLITWHVVYHMTRKTCFYKHASCSGRKKRNIATSSVILHGVLPLMGPISLPIVCSQFQSNRMVTDGFPSQRANNA